jgi:hypothetical protein
MYGKTNFEYIVVPFRYILPHLFIFLRRLSIMANFTIEHSGCRFEPGIPADHA